MSQNTKRSLHCSFCDDEGHTINNCKDPHINFLLKEFNESISLDIKCNFKMKYMNYVLSLCSVPEIKIIGYQKNISMNKLSKEEIINEISEEYYDKTNRLYSEIIDNMNDAELNYFAKKIADSSKSWNPRKISFNKVKQLLGISNTTINKDTKEILIPRNDSLPRNDSQEIDLQFYVFPLIDKSTLDELSPILKNSLN